MLRHEACSSALIRATCPARGWLKLAGLLRMCTSAEIKDCRGTDWCVSGPDGDARREGGGGGGWAGVCPAVGRKVGADHPLVSWRKIRAAIGSSSKGRSLCTSDSKAEVCLAQYCLQISSRHGISHWNKGYTEIIHTHTQFCSPKMQELPYV